MEAIDHLIKKFWAGEATEAEKQQLLEYMTRHEAAWKNYLQQHYQQQSYETAAVLTNERADEVLNRLHAQIAIPATNVKRLHPYKWTRWVAAAVILLAVGLVIYKYQGHDLAHKQVAQQKADTLFQQHHNNTQHTETIRLPDASLVRLEPGSSIRYEQLFNHRAIQLQGEARFKVEKALNRPFSVTAKGFVTTALGTEFSINASGSKVAVKLLEGKVMVQPAAGSNMTMATIYLTPGKEFVVNTELRQYRLQEFDNSAMAGADNNTGKQPHRVVLSFNKTPLNEVFSSIGRHYRTTIDFDTAAVRGLSFTGVFEQSDSLQIILAAICNMNDLTFKQQANRITIIKPE